VTCCLLCADTEHACAWCVLQEVYSTIEQLVDKMSLQAGHASLIYECTGRNLAKLLSCMVSRQTWLCSK
jgi:hypothetical protein